jgi:hypothetical protein
MHRLRNQGCKITFYFFRATPKSRMDLYRASIRETLIKSKNKLNCHSGEKPESSKNNLFNWNAVPVSLQRGMFAPA